MEFDASKISFYENFTENAYNLNNVHTFEEH